MNLMSSIYKTTPVVNHEAMDETFLAFVERKM